MAIVSVVKTSGIPGQLSEGVNGIVGGFFAPLLDIDCVRQPTIASFPSNALTTYGGKSWLGRFNGAPDLANGSVNSLFGTGLRFNSSGNNSLWSGALTGSRIELDLRQLAPLLGDMLDGPLRVRIWFATPLPMNANFQFFHVCIASMSNTALNLASGIGFNATDGGLTTTAFANHGGGVLYMNATLLGANDVQDVRFTTPFSLSIRAGRYDATKPDPWPIGAWQGTIGTQPIFGALDTWAQNAAAGGALNNGLKLILGTSTGATGVPFNNLTVKRIAVDQWRSGA